MKKGTKIGIIITASILVLIVAAVIILSGVIAICVLYPKKDVSAVLCPTFTSLSFEYSI